MQFKIDTTEKKLIIGLGNIGKTYEHTRHNAGFMFIDYLLNELHNAEDEMHTKETASYILIRYLPFNLYLIKPKTMMNRSGTAVREVLKFTDVEKSQILLVHDDLDIKLGSYKLQTEKSPKQHNGVTSVEQELGFTDFPRLRIGIDNRENTHNAFSGSDYVLAKFSEEEILLINDLFGEVLAELTRV